MKHSEEHYRLFFGNKADYYFKVLSEIEDGKGSRFNVFAFLFGFFWMFYRKLYRLILIIFLFIFLEVIIEQTIIYFTNAPENVEIIIDRISYMLYGLIFGFIANRSYIKMAERKISKIKTLNLSEEETNKKIQKVGGTTLLPHLILLVIMVIVITLGKQGYLSY